MTDELDFLRQLQNAKSDDERTWLVTKHSLDSLPVDLAQMAYAAAVPHWFDAKILAALRPELIEKAETLYADLQRLPFIEPFSGRGHNVHELTRKLMLDYLWREKREEYVELSKRAVIFFVAQIADPSFYEQLTKIMSEEQGEEKQQEKLKSWLEKNPDAVKPPDPQSTIEQIYHLLIANPEKGADAVLYQGWKWHDEFDYTYATLSALTKAVREHVEAGRVDERGKGWGRFFEGMICYYRYQLQETVVAFLEVIASNYTDNKLNADTRFRLGEVHVYLSELKEARTRYEQALPLYQAIGEKLGEANCISSLGDVHVRLSELPQARTRYEQALPLYRAIGNRLGETNCIQALGDVALEEKVFDLALKHYGEAIIVARSISPAVEANKIDDLAYVYVRQKDYTKAIQIYSLAINTFPNHAHSLNNRAMVYIKLKDTQSAEQDIEASAQLQPERPYLFARRGELAILLGNYDEAIAHFKSAIERYPRMNGAYFGIGLANLHTGRISEATEAYRQGLKFTYKPSDLEDALDELDDLKKEQPTLEGVEEVLRMLNEWKPGGSSTDASQSPLRVSG